MSVDMNTDGSDMDDDMYASDEDNYDNYYDDNADDVEFIDKFPLKDDPEHFEFELLKIEDVERLLNENVEAVCNELNVSCKIFLFAWGKVSQFEKPAKSSLK
jgi:ariadne-2